MKRLLLASCIFISLQANAQIWDLNANNIKITAQMHDSILAVPNDTAVKMRPKYQGAIKGDSGRIAYKYGKFWGKVNIGGVLQWKELGAGSSGAATLQAVTDEGNTTDNAVAITGNNNSLSTGGNMLYMWLGDGEANIQSINKPGDDLNPLITTSSTNRINAGTFQYYREGTDLMMNA